MSKNIPESSNNHTRQDFYLNNSNTTRNITQEHVGNILLEKPKNNKELLQLVKTYSFFNEKELECIETCLREKEYPYFSHEYIKYIMKRVSKKCKQRTSSLQGDEFGIISFLNNDPHTQAQKFLNIFQLSPEYVKYFIEKWNLPYRLIASFSYAIYSEEALKKLYHFDQIIDFTKSELKHIHIAQHSDIDAIRYLLNEGYISKNDLFNENGKFFWIRNVKFENLKFFNFSQEELKNFIQTERNQSFLWEKIPENILKSWENFVDNPNTLQQFFSKKIIPNNDASRILLENNIPKSKNLQEAFTFLLKHKQKSLIDWWIKLATNYDMNLWVSDPDFEALQKYIEENNFEAIKNFYKNFLISEKTEKSIQRAMEVKDMSGIYKIIGHILIENFENNYNQKWLEKIQDTFQDLDIDEEKAQNPDFIEAFKMSVQPPKNKEQIRKLLRQYLRGDFDNVENLNQFNTPKNREWLQKYLTLEQQQIWLQSNTKTITINPNHSLTIEKELNPLKILMMGNCVQWSCLHFHHPIWNYWSVVSNAIDVNKWVFYIYADSEKKNFLGRVIVSIWNDRKISRFPMYYAKEKISYLDDYFDAYLTMLAENMKLKLNGEGALVENIESEDWHSDSVQIIFPEK